MILIVGLPFWKDTPLSLHDPPSNPLPNGRNDHALGTVYRTNFLWQRLTGQSRTKPHLTQQHHQTHSNRATSRAPPLVLKEGRKVTFKRQKDLKGQYLPPKGQQAKKKPQKCNLQACLKWTETDLKGIAGHSPVPLNSPLLCQWTWVGFRPKWIKASVSFILISTLHWNQSPRNQVNFNSLGMFY